MTSLSASGRTSLRLTEIRPEVTVLVVVDMQNDYVHHDGAVIRRLWHRRARSTPAERMVPRLRAFVDVCRKAGAMVIWIRTLETRATASPFWAQQGTSPAPEGSWGASLYSGLEPVPGEPEVIKHRHSAFFETELDTILRARKIATVLVAGVGTPYCVESTARDAFARDYRTITLSDCTATREPEEHRAALARLGTAFGSVVRSARITRVWRTLPRTPARKRASRRKSKGARHAGA